MKQYFIIEFYDGEICLCEKSDDGYLVYSNVDNVVSFFSTVAWHQGYFNSGYVSTGTRTITTATWGSRGNYMNNIVKKINDKFTKIGYIDPSSTNINFNILKLFKEITENEFILEML